MSEEDGLNYKIENNSVKLVKNTKGFNWEIKVVANPGETNEEVLDQVHKINAELKSKYGEPVRSPA